MRLAWPGLAQAGAAFGVGAVMAAGQAPLGFWWMTLAGLAALTALVVRAPGARAAGWLGWFGGAGYFALALSWIIEPFLVDPDRYAWMAPFAVVFMSFGLALFWAAAAMLAARLDVPRRALGFALLLVLAEVARGHVLTGFPWAQIGHVWIDTSIAQVAAVFGPTGLALATALAAALPVGLGWRGLGAAAVLLSVLAGFGLWRLGQSDPADRAPQLRLVQPNAEQTLKWDPVMARTYFDRLLQFTALPGSARPDLVIWPETAVPYLLERNPEVTAIVAEAAQGATVILGVQREEGLRFFNSLVSIGPDARIMARYDKHHLVPFGEYIPFGDLAYSLFGVSAFAARQGNGYSPGPGAAILDLGPSFGRVLPLICYEAVFPQDLRNAPGRADWILQITNDAWFGRLSGPYQHFAQARLRTIEQGLPMIRVANTGVSGVIDAKGRVRATIPLGQAAYLDTALPGALPPTVFARFGELPGLALLAGLAASLLLAGRRQRT
jgi:apolipoprotein N-acyltransferase